MWMRRANCGRRCCRAAAGAPEAHAWGPCREWGKRGRLARAGGARGQGGGHVGGGLGAPGGEHALALGEVKGAGAQGFGVGASKHDRADVARVAESQHMSKLVRGGGQKLRGARGGVGVEIHGPALDLSGGGVGLGEGEAGDALGEAHPSHDGGIGGGILAGAVGAIGWLGALSLVGEARAAGPPGSGGLGDQGDGALLGHLGRKAGGIDPKWD